MNGTICYNIACKLEENGFEILRYDLPWVDGKFYRTYMISKKYKQYKFFEKNIYFGHLEENDACCLTNIEEILNSIHNKKVKSQVAKDYQLAKAIMKQYGGEIF